MNESQCQFSCQKSPHSFENPYAIHYTPMEWSHVGVLQARQLSWLEAISAWRKRLESGRSTETFRNEVHQDSNSDCIAMEISPTPGRRGKNGVFQLGKLLRLLVALRRLLHSDHDECFQALQGDLSHFLNSFSQEESWLLYCSSYEEY